MNRFIVWMGTLAWVGCADPCFDDGLAQGGCPTNDTDTTTSGATMTGTGASVSTTGTATLGTATMGTATAGSMTMGTATLGTMTEATLSADGTADATETDSAGSLTDVATDSESMTMTGASEGVVCPELRRVLVPQVPTVQLVVDQSGSMDDDFGMTSRWEAVRDTLVDETDGVVVGLQSYVRFGLTLYTGTLETCPRITQLGPQLDASDEITTVLDAASPESETPTGESLVLATQFLLEDPWEGDKVLVLATDGEPDTCDNPGPMEGEELDEVRALTVAAVEAAYEQGIRTFVISVGDDVAEEHLQALANAGVGEDPDGDAEFYTALDPEALADAFEDVIAGVRSCSLELERPLPAQYASSCSVTVNGDVVAYEDEDGWTLHSDESSIALQGDSCRAIQEGVVSIEMTCTCEVGG